MKRVHGRGPVDVIAHGGIGCYSMAFLPPFEEMHNLSAMGLGGATGAGAAPLVTNKHYVLVGDGTFFHGEMSTIANAIKQRQDILFIILDNKNTAMTGHQGTPASETDLMGRPQSAAGDRADRRGDGPGLPAALQPRRPRRPHGPHRAGAADGRDARDHRRQGVRDHVGAPRGAERAAVVRERGYLPGGHPLQHRRGDLRELPRVHDRHRLPRPRAREHAARPEGRHQRGRLRRRRLLRPHQGLPELRAGHRDGGRGPRRTPGRSWSRRPSPRSPPAPPCTGSTSPGSAGWGSASSGAS